MARLRDSNERGIQVLSKEEGEAKRPEMYGLPVCEHCTHAPHPKGLCPFCEEESKPPDVKLVLCQGSSI